MLYNILISEEACGRGFDSDILSAFSRTKVNGEDMRFLKADSSSLKLMTTALSPAVKGIIGMGGFEGLNLSGVSFLSDINNAESIENSVQYSSAVSLENIIYYERSHLPAFSYITDIKLLKDSFILRYLYLWRRLLGNVMTSTDLNRTVLENSWDIGSLLANVMILCEVDDFSDEPQFDKERVSRLTSGKDDVILNNLRYLAFCGKLKTGTYSLKNYLKALAETIAYRRERSSGQSTMSIPLECLEEQLRRLVYSSGSLKKLEALCDELIPEIDKRLATVSYMYETDRSAPISEEGRNEETEDVKKALTDISYTKEYDKETILNMFEASCLSVKEKYFGANYKAVAAEDKTYCFMVEGR